MEYFKNNVPQRQIAKTLQISSSTVHNIIKRFREFEKSLSIRDKAKDFVGCPWYSGPQTMASLISMILSLTLLNGPRNTSRNHCHNPPCHMEMPTKALSYKKEAICEHGREAPPCPPVGQGSFKIESFKVEKCFMDRRVKI